MQVSAVQHAPPVSAGPDRDSGGSRVGNVRQAVRNQVSELRESTRAAVAEAGSPEERAELISAAKAEKEALIREVYDKTHDRQGPVLDVSA